MVALLALAALLSPNLISANAPKLVIGQVSDQDILADRTLSYTSEVLTDRKREEVQASIKEIYSLPEIGVAREQMDRLRNTMAYISSVRSDPRASMQQKIEDLINPEDLSNVCLHPNTWVLLYLVLYLL